jgi:transposase-like protein
MLKRTHFIPEEKLAIVRRHHLEGVLVSDLATSLGIHATQDYNWQKQLFENAASAIERRPNKANQRRPVAAAERKNAELQAKLHKKNEVVADLLEEHVQKRRGRGEP